MNTMAQKSQEKKRNKDKTLKKIFKKLGIIVIPVVILTLVLFSFISTILTSASDNVLSDNLSDAENSNLVEYSKEKVDRLGKDAKDYYGTDKSFKLEYQYVLSFVKYISSSEDNKIAGEGAHTFEALKSEIDRAITTLSPKFEYKTDKIITIKEYKVKTKKFTSEVFNGDESTLTDTIKYQIEPSNFNALSYKSGDKIFIRDEHKIYTCTEVEEVKTERKEEDAFFVTNVKTIKETYDITYETKTDVSQKDGEKLTITRPVITAMVQKDKDWDNLKSIIASTYQEENINDAVEVILASAASYVNDDVTQDMIYTGGGTGGLVTGEKFTGSQSEFIQKIVPKAVEDYHKYRILPSITIAQAVLESGFGDSQLTKKANNLFGIKAFGWKGPTMDMLTKEYRADKSSYYVMATFRAYNSWDDSIEDHSRVLMQSNFAAVRNAADYRSAAVALRAGGYATDPAYPSLVISIIEQYGLEKYDK